VGFIFHLEGVGYNVQIKVEKVWFNEILFQAIRQQKVKNLKGGLDLLLALYSFEFSEIIESAFSFI